jgi:very-short-patch-repair endonuclease
MTEFFNRTSEKAKRQQLRNNMPPAEVILWSRLQRRQLLGCKFRRQYSVGAFVIDFYSPEIKLGIELDGDSHYREGGPEYDRERQEYIASFGITIVRFINPEVYDNLDGVVEMIAREITMRRAAPPQPPLRKLLITGIVANT